MFIDQNEIDTLLGQADGLATETAAELAQPEAPAAPPPPPIVPSDPEIARILKIRVPVIAQLAARPMSVAEIRRFATGAIIEFEKSLEEDLDLLINNRPIGHGTCVKVGENFGLRVTEIANAQQRIESMGA